jgi:hypothetical protein
VFFLISLYSSCIQLGSAPGVPTGAPVLSFAFTTVPLRVALGVAFLTQLPESRILGFNIIALLGFVGRDTIKVFRTFLRVVLAAAV